jgi:hypothetical protein
MRENGRCFQAWGISLTGCGFFSAGLSRKSAGSKLKSASGDTAASPARLMPPSGFSEKVADGAVPPVRFERFVLPVLQIGAHGRLGWGADLPGSSTRVRRGKQTVCTKRNRDNQTEQRWMVSGNHARIDRG